MPKGVRNGSNRRNKKRLRVVGSTEDGKKVVNGDFIFRLMESRGLPLEDILFQLDENNCIIDWIGFYKESQKAQWQVKTFLLRIETTVREVFGKIYCEQVMLRLRKYIEMEERPDGHGHK
jgi:alanyl-tRNA synthetase